jgi:segregation and condensation protein B
MDADIPPATNDAFPAEGSSNGDATIDQSMAPELISALEAIVLVATEPVPVDQLAQLLEVSAALVDATCEQLAADYATEGRGFVLVRVAGGWRFQSHPDTAAYVERFILDGQRARLSGAALETLAIVAYKQPISRAQIAAIRGVDPDGVLRTLQGRGYIDQIGRDPGPGQAVLWGTTTSFLEKLGIDNLDQLPALAEFVPGADIVEALEHGLRVTPLPVDLPAPFDDADAPADDTPADEPPADEPPADEMPADDKTTDDTPA